MTTRKTTTKIIWHCTATPEGREVTKDDLYRWHVIENGWSDIGYHYLITLEGNIVPCREEHLVGAHVKGENNDSIGIAYAGGITNDGTQRAKDTRTDAQVAAMYSLTDKLLDKYDLNWDDVYGHNQFAAKACPSFDVVKDVANSDYTSPDEDGEIEPNLPDLGEPNKILMDLLDAFQQITNRLALMDQLDEAGKRRDESIQRLDQAFQELRNHLRQS
jgi:N-acetylmuramoyl-L-alanine amidase